MDKNYWNDKEFFVWAFGNPSIEITLVTFELALEKLYQCYLAKMENKEKG